MKGLPSAETAAYSDICEYFEQRMGNPQWKGFPQFAVTVELIRVSLALMRPHTQSTHLKCLTQPHT